ncbi:adenosylcobinamide-phosphate synthase CbiB [Uliginosibacterium gangwonense]|uniref:adenosylcobinamide-phosphate synthase CbiB n=1 Tax=Uliginosibacterium gangwonense TaxID=392736 RepID=UPI00038015FC|nr:adenosylcobinamide-phosphate synthase CbiB [Uliginosibacterium gangwonense]
MTITLSLLLGIIADRLFGELPRWHPLVGFGHCAQWLEQRLNLGNKRHLRGILGWCLLVLPPTLIAAGLSKIFPGWVVAGMALYLALGARALQEHGMAVAVPLAQGDLATARHRVSYLVSRETEDMDEEAIARATVESVLENGNDAIFGAIFWCVVAGAPGVILFRLANTLDAMWGYRNERFNHFGWAAARIDDVLNFIPARLTALSYAILGQTRVALRSWHHQAPLWSSPNAGPVMAAGAGSLGVRLGGAATYEGEVEQRPTLGAGAAASAEDIPRASILILRSMLLWVVVISVVESLSL